jgi:hypothetical protein
MRHTAAALERDAAAVDAWIQTRDGAAVTDGQPDDGKTLPVPTKAVAEQFPEYLPLPPRTAVMSALLTAPAAGDDALAPAPPADVLRRLFLQSSGSDADTSLSASSGSSTFSYRTILMRVLLPVQILHLFHGVRRLGTTRRTRRAPRKAAPLLDVTDAESSRGPGARRGRGFISLLASRRTTIEAAAVAQARAQLWGIALQCERTGDLVPLRRTLTTTLRILRAGERSAMRLRGPMATGIAQRGKAGGGRRRDNLRPLAIAHGVLVRGVENSMRPLIHLHAECFMMLRILERRARAASGASGVTVASALATSNDLSVLTRYYFAIESSSTAQRFADNRLASRLTFLNEKAAGSDTTERGSDGDDEADVVMRMSCRGFGAWIARDLAAWFVAVDLPAQAPHMSVQAATNHAVLLNNAMRFVEIARRRAFVSPEDDAAILALAPHVRQAATALHARLIEQLPERDFSMGQASLEERRRMFEMFRHGHAAAEFLQGFAASNWPEPDDASAAEELNVFPGRR